MVLGSQYVMNAPSYTNLSLGFKEEKSKKIELVPARTQHDSADRRLLSPSVPSTVT